MIRERETLGIAEDADDLAAFEKRKREPDLDFEQFVKTLRRRGKI
jgi:predicted nucleotidyltransferase